MCPVKSYTNKGPWYNTRNSYFQPAYFIYPKRNLNSCDWLRFFMSESKEKESILSIQQIQQIPPINLQNQWRICFIFSTLQSRIMQSRNNEFLFWRRNACVVDFLDSHVEDHFWCYPLWHDFVTDFQKSQQLILKNSQVTQTDLIVWCDVL